MIYLLITILITTIIILIQLAKILKYEKFKEEYKQLLNSRHYIIIMDEEIIDSILFGKRIYCRRITSSDKVIMKSRED